MLLENTKTALAGLMANKLRTFLTMLGIIIGIASIIAIMYVSDAMNNSVMDSMGDMGASTISVYITQKNVDFSEDDYYEDESNSNVRAIKNSDLFTQEMLDDIESHFSNQIEGISLTLGLGDIQVTDKKKYANISLNGMNETAISQKKLKLLAGRTFSQSDYDNKKNVCLISDKYVNNMLNGNIDKALGSQIEVVLGSKYYSYTVIGVYEYQEAAGSYSSGGNAKSIRTNCYIPIKTAIKQSNSNQYFEYFDIIGKNGVDTTALATEITTYINEKFYSKNDTYESYAYSMKAEIESMESMLKTQKLAFMAIGAISLLVGGIGVMNIMIVSITERTREIGTRKALGATNNDIRMQFITEAMVVCLIGGIIGVVVGLAMGVIASKVMSYTGHVSLSSIFFCIIFSIAFGVFFGYYPANKAAKLNPIEALRYE